MHAFPSTRQGANNYNQPVSFNTSSVTDMSSMFHVRSPRMCPAPQSSTVVWVLRVYRARRLRPPLPYAL